MILEDKGMSDEFAPKNIEIDWHLTSTSIKYGTCVLLSFSLFDFFPSMHDYKFFCILFFTFSFFWGGCVSLVKNYWVSFASDYTYRSYKVNKISLKSNTEINLNLHELSRPDNVQNYIGHCVRKFQSLNVYLKT